MRVLVTGGSGMLGGHLARRLGSAGWEVHTVDRHERAPVGAVSHVAELSVAGRFDEVVAATRPDLVVHTAYSMEDLDRDVVAASENVIDACATHDVALVHMSTDAVFDGEHAPYCEQDVPRPVHPYGVAKRQVELLIAERLPAAAVVRTSLIAHLDPAGPDSATAWVVEANRRGEPVTLFHDEYRSVVRLVDLLDVLMAVVELPAEARSGHWHVAGPQRMSRAELGAVIAEVFGLDRSLIRTASADTVTASRPRDVTLSAERVRRELHLSPLPVATVPHHGQQQR